MLHERLTENESDWGVSRIEHTLRQRRRQRELARVRRALYLQSNVSIRPRDARGMFVAERGTDHVSGEVWMTPSGILAYSKNGISLPFVSILGRSIHREG